MCLFKQISNYFESIFSKFQYGFKKGHNTQHCLLALLEKWRKSMDQGILFGAFLTDLSKAFNCLSHDLLAAKLFAYGFDKVSFKLPNKLEAYNRNSLYLKLMGECNIWCFSRINTWTITS